MKKLILLPILLSACSSAPKRSYEDLEKELLGLQIRNEKLEQDVSFYKDRERELEMKYREVRIAAGLAPEESRKKIHITPEGNIAKIEGEGYNEEIKSLIKKKQEKEQEASGEYEATE